MRILNAIAAILAASCSRSTPASYCAVVNAQGAAASAELVQLFDHYAASKQLRMDKSSPVLAAYYNAEDSVELGARLGFGDFGAAVTLYSRDVNATEGYVKDLEAFMSTVVGGRFTVRRCADIEGFALPHLSGWPKREGAT